MNFRGSTANWTIGAGLGLLVVVGVAGAGFFLWRQMTNLTTRVAVLEANLASTTAELASTITKTHTTLAEALDAEKQNAAAIEEKLGNFEENVGDITDTVSTLEKLSQTDPELLQKYSKIFFLNEHYAPARLVEIPTANRYRDDPVLKIHAEVWPYLRRLLAAAKKAGVEIYVSSAFRSFNEQSALKGQYTTVYGAGTANQFSADQGYSEHQLGTTVDFITTGLGGALEGFDKTEAYDWLEANAHRFGFTLSYPKNNSYYVFEPWHWRFVGVDLATDLYQEGEHFYDLDQRDIDKYLVSIFD